MVEAATVEFTEARDKAIVLAKQDTTAAWAAAKGIGHPWFRAQALAWVARYADEASFLAVAREALEAAAQCEDAYQCVGSSAWPIRALLERGYPKEADEALNRSLALLPAIEPGGSRAEAARLLLHAAFGLGTQVAARLVRELLAIHEKSRHWRALRALGDGLSMLATRDAGTAREIAARVADDWARRKAERAMARTPAQEPRPFFW